MFPWFIRQVEQSKHNKIQKSYNPAPRGLMTPKKMPALSRAVDPKNLKTKFLFLQAEWPQRKKQDNSSSHGVGWLKRKKQQNSFCLRSGWPKKKEARKFVLSLGQITWKEESRKFLLPQGRRALKKKANKIHAPWGANDQKETSNREGIPLPTACFSSI